MYYSTRNIEAYRFGTDLNLNREIIELKPKPKQWSEVLSNTPKSELHLALVSNIKIHEEFDPKRTAPLARKIASDLAQKNPIIVVKAPNGQLVHLDGANRTASLKQLGCRFILTQKIDYKQEGTLNFGTWIHLNQISRVELMQRYSDSLIRANPAYVIECLRLGKIPIAIWFSHNEVYVMRCGSSLAEMVESWNKVTGLYRKKTTRINPTDVDPIEAVNQNLANSETDNVCVMFSAITIEDVINITCEMKTQIPAGITRVEVLCGRDTNINFPLSILKTPLSTEKRAKLLSNHMALLKKRSYSEPINSYEPA